MKKFTTEDTESTEEEGGLTDLDRRWLARWNVAAELGCAVAAIVLIVLIFCAFAGCSEARRYEGTVSARQVGVSGAYDGRDYKGVVSYRVEYRP